MAELLHEAELERPRSSETRFAVWVVRRTIVQVGGMGEKAARQGT